LGLWFAKSYASIDVNTIICKSSNSYFNVSFIHYMIFDLKRNLKRTWEENEKNSKELKRIWKEFEKNLKGTWKEIEKNLKRAWKEPENNSSRPAQTLSYNSLLAAIY